MLNPFKIFFPQRMVGIDIGTASIKVVEVFSWGKVKTLKNYAEAKSTFANEGLPSGQKISSTIIPSNLASLAIKEILDEADIKTKSVIFSIPDFYTFCTSFDIPPMPEKEIAEAIVYNASQYITLPISEVTLDWRIISNPPIGNNSSMKVFVVAIPNQIIQDYRNIAKDAGLELCALEAEVFGLAKALIKDTSGRESKKTICLLDIGAQSSTINVIDQGFLKGSYSSNFSSNQLTNVISSALAVDYNQTQEIKNKEGLNSSRESIKISYQPVDSLLTELKNISAEFFQSEKKQIEEIYLTGGAVDLPGLKEYFAKSIQRQVFVPNCFSGLSYPSVLEKTLKEISPRFSIAVGIALDGLEI